MKPPKRLLPLIEDGLIDEVISPLMSGKEASVWVVRCGNDIRCAKVYKDAAKRSFKQAATYQEGRKVRNSRRARAMEKGSKYGRRQQESTWQNAEVDALYRLADIGVRVPEPFGCVDGVLLMELVTDDDGEVASRLNDVILTHEQALEDHALVMHYVKLMLCAGLVHGDLSEFNVLVDAYGPVIIDLPQAVDAAANNNAERMLARDVANMTRYYAQFAPELAETRYAPEIWSLYKSGDLHPELELTGEFDLDEANADVEGVLDEIHAILMEEEERQVRQEEEDESDD
ncbi:PA4780 family RIO1-like protein kinase [Saccharospirillum salsuginis]|uniref:non-specific serine/threonine protein kinase n=1 Tax=Saccharospirillum salsuginis TaxID=418750 RepID=A0A918K3V7_9GAMM|nr:PA4780 family RIO1-like protein kinase [Saccharospirillum salsuginis]GGX42715.1 serine/threonine protein kinase [Saccharospirillum salsuginis]